MPRYRSTNFGISIEPTWPIEYSVALSVLAEKLGFSNLWVPDGGPSPPFGDTIVTLAAIASKTRRISFGSAILNFYTRNPAVIASSFLALSRLGGISRQRAILGIGVGADFNVAKIGIGKREGMIIDLREAIEAIRDLFHGKEVTARTSAFAIEHVALSRSKKEIPIHVGSQSPKGLRLAGEIADGVILTDRIPSEIEESMKHVVLGLADSSRDRRDLEVTNSVVISVDEDSQKARRASKVTAAYLVGWMDEAKARLNGIDLRAKRRISEFLAHEDEASAAKLVDRKMIELLTVSGTPDECVERCKEHLSHGIDQIAFCEPFGPKPMESLKLIYRKIIPRL